MSTKAATSASNSTSRYRHGEAVSYSIPGPRLLVVRDHKKTAQVLARELEAMGYVSDISGTAAEARAALEIGDYVALVLDLDLQGGDGLAVLREIRQREDPIAVITISARNSVHDRINVLRSGADDCIAKPFSYGELVARLETVLRRYDHRFAPLQVANLVFDPVSRQTFVDQRL
jgi:DNA-binding response OmpR family regulator